MNTQPNKQSISQRLKLKPIALALMLSTLTGCQTTDNSGNSGNSITLNFESEDMLFWLTYGIAQPACQKQFQPYTFGEFYCTYAISSSVAIGSAKKYDESTDKTNEDPPTQFERTLTKVSDAGYLEEYVYHFYNQSHWFKQPNLELNAFNQWLEQHLPNHQAPAIDGNVSIKQSQATETPITTPVALDNHYIKQAGAIKANKQTKLDGPGHGWRLTYLDDNKEDFFVDIFVYPKVNYKPTISEQTRHYLVDEMTLVKMGILYYVDQGVYSNFKIVDEQIDDEGNFVSSHYLIDKQYKPHSTFSYLTEHQGVLIKARSSQARDNTTDYSQDIKAVMDNLKQHVSIQ